VAPTVAAREHANQAKTAFGESLESFADRGYFQGERFSHAKAGINGHAAKTSDVGREVEGRLSASSTFSLRVAEEDVNILSCR